jgi:hypothetical protein
MEEEDSKRDFGQVNGTCLTESITPFHYLNTLHGHGQPVHIYSRIEFHAKN